MCYSIMELSNNIVSLKKEALLEYLKEYYKKDKFNTKVILWDESFLENEYLKNINNMSCVEGLFPDMRLMFLNKNVFFEMIKNRTAQVKLDYSIGFDVNIASYVLNPNTTNRCFNENFEQTIFNNFDIFPYIVENYLKYGDEFFTNEYVYKNIFELFKLIYSNMPDEFIRIEIDSLFRNIKSNKDLFKEFKDNHLRLQIFISGLIFANWHFSKKEERIRYIMHLFDKKIGQFMKREFIYAVKYFEKNKTIMNFFNQKTNLNVNEFDLIKNIENLAYDLLLVRNTEYYSSLRQVRPNTIVDGFVPLIFSGDENLLKLLKVVKIKALIISENNNIKKITPVYIDDIDSIIRKYGLDDFFDIDRVYQRKNQNINLEENVKEIQNTLIEEFIKQKENKLKNKKYKIKSEKTKKCIYCNQYKDESDFSLEHIFPSALGGKYLDDDLFKTHNVCKKCNNWFGLYVDGMFLKSFFIKNEVFNHYLDFVNEIEDITVPFVFIGTLKKPSISHPKYRYCDYWVWAGGSRVYHFHSNYNQFFNSYVGGHPIKFKSKKEAGEVYLVGAMENIDEKLFKIMLFSFKEHFKHQKRFSVNIELNLIDERTKKNNEIKFFDEPDEIQKYIKNKILETANQEHEMLITIQQGSEWKFLSKIAIGLGYNLFGDNYLESDDYKIFHNIINAMDINEIKNILTKNPVMGEFLSNITNSLKHIGEVVAFKSGHTLLFQIINNELYFVMWLYNKNYPFVVKIASDITKFKENNLLKKHNNGFVYICVPAKKLSIGPLDLGEYMQDKEKFLNMQQEEILNT